MATVALLPRIERCEQQIHEMQLRARIKPLVRTVEPYDQRPFQELVAERVAWIEQDLDELERRLP